MSVNRTDYIVIGAKLKYNNIFSDMFFVTHEFKPPKGYEVIVDGYNGKYIIIGRVAFKDKDNVGFNFFNLNTSYPVFMDIEKENIYNFLPKEYNRFLETNNHEWGVWLFTHWS